jgi:hypothetical protein
MRKIILLLVSLFMSGGADLHASLLINEFVTNTTDDWVELTLTGTARDKLDISRLYVTMYYGSNEPLSTEPVTIYSYDRRETPYDDRFVVVHCAHPNTPDETDRTGDTNGNGYIDIYCANYSASLWNTEGVVAIDTDDDPANGGIIDFVYYSNHDGTPNDTVSSYVVSAQAQAQWRANTGKNIQQCAVNIGAGGLMSFTSASRKNGSDTNSAADFAITNIQTPGKPNVTLPLFMGKRIFKPLRKKITVIPGHLIFGTGAIPVFVFVPCCMKLRVFSMNGLLVHESPLFPSVKPGLFNLFWNPLLQHHDPHTGLYLCKIEAVTPSLRSSEEETIYIIVSRYL